MTFNFKNGDKIAGIGLGTWKAREGAAGFAVAEALKLGYKHIDCAAIYQNEEEIGEAFNNAFSNGIKREDVHITSKLWNNAHLAKDVEPALKKTLNDLQLEYLDLYLMHWPVAIKPDVLNATQAEDYIPLDQAPLIETWEAMVELKKNGLVKHIGVSNFSVKKLKALMEKTDVIPEVNQIELHPYLQQEEMFQFCNANDILLTAYSPLGSIDRSAGMKRDDEPALMEDAKIKEIAKNHNASPAQILIAWHINRGNTVIPKSSNKERLAENLKAGDITLSNDELKAIQALDRHYRFITGKFFELPGNGYENIYDE